MLVKLRARGFRDGYIEWVPTFLESRLFHLRVEGEVSEWAAAPSGVPQGSVVGPFLFVAYSNDLPEVLSSFSFLFADDLKIVNCSSKADYLSADMHTAALSVSRWDM